MSKHGSLFCVCIRQSEDNRRKKEYEEKELEKKGERERERQISQRWLFTFRTSSLSC